MQSSAASNNRFAALSGLKTPSGKFVLASAGSSGEKETPAATGSNAIPIRGNKKGFGKKVGTGPTLKRKPNMDSLKPMPINRAQSARPGLLATRPTNKKYYQAESLVRPSNRATALKRAISMPLLHPAPSMDQFPPLVPRQFLRSAEDRKMNTGSSSYSNVAQRGVKTGSKQSFRSEAFARMRLARRLRIGFLSHRMRKTYLPRETFWPLGPYTKLTYHGRLLTRMMIWHWGKQDEMEGR